MHRRNFLKSSAGIAAAIAPGTAMTSAAEGIRAPSLSKSIQDVVLSSPWPDNSGGYADQVFGFGQRLERASDGRLKVHYQTSTQTNSGQTQTASGQIDLRFGLTHEHVALHPAFGFFAGLPAGMGLPFDALERWLIAGGGSTLWDELSAAYGLKMLLAGHSGPGLGLWSARPLTSISDFTDQTIQTGGLADDVVKSLGGIPGRVASQDFPHALARGDVRAAEWGNGAHCLAAGLADHVKYCTTTGLYRHGGSLTVTVSQRVWDRLGASLQAVLMATAATEARRSIAEASANHAILSQALREVKGVQFYPLPQDVAAVSGRVAEAIVAELAARDRITARINESYVRAHAANMGAELLFNAV
jgi:TRAP-type mannitol/chloroaromatic compound transport system substrate-binding protein